MKLFKWLRTEDNQLVVRAERFPCTLSAFYWNGGSVTAAEIKDISETGAYVVTSERWYTGTILCITVHTKLSGDEPESVTVPCRVARQGKDGMGISFIFDGKTDQKVSRHFIDHLPHTEKQLESERKKGKSPITRPGNERGSSLVELSLALPILMLLLTGIFSFAIALNNYLMLTNAVTNGAQILAISRQQTTDPCATGSAAVISAAPLLTSANLTFSFVLNGTTYSGQSCTAGAANLTQGTTASIAVTYPCTLAVYGVNYAPSCTLRAHTAELVQ